MPESQAFAPLSLDIQDLSCSRGGRMVFAGLSLRVEPGRVLAVMGPNGAGKSSLLRVVAGLLEAESGTIAFEGRREDEAVVHYLGHFDAAKPALTLSETLRFWMALYGDDWSAPDVDMVHSAEIVGLAHALELPVGRLSAGQRRRAALARLMLSPRPLWLLDEPSSALDAEGEGLLKRLMEDHCARGGLIVAATHLPLPVEPDAVLELGVA
jgi:heme exporter protein A